jgi:acetyl-CoA synthetase
MRPEDLQRSVKPHAGWRVPPNMLGYEATRGAFSWEAAKRELAGLPGERGLDIAHEAVERHCLEGRGEHPALRWLGWHGEREVFTYAELSAWTSRFANALDALGIG